MSTRKRARALPPSDNSDEDELSPTKPKPDKDRFGTITKKRKLNAYGLSPGLQGAAAKTGFLGRITGIFSYGKTNEKENLPAEDEDEDGDGDELVKDTEADKSAEDIWDVPDDDAPVVHPRITRKKTKKAVAKIGKAVKAVAKAEESPDLDSSDAEQELAVINPTRKPRRSSVPNPKPTAQTPDSVVKRGRPKKILDKELQDLTAEKTERGESAPPKQRNSKKSREGMAGLKPAKPIEHLDVTPKRGRPVGSKKSSEASAGTRTPKSGTTKSTLDRDHITTPKSDGGRISSTEEGTASSPRRSVGRPRKSDILKRAKQLSREAIRKEMSRHGADEEHNDNNDNNDNDNGPENSAGPPMRRRNIRSESKLNSNNAGKLVALDSEVMRRTGRNIDVLGDAEHIKPKGILTPSKSREGPRVRKSVVFEDLKEADLGFKDLPSTSNKKQSAETGTPEAGYQGTSEEGSEEDGEDEIACSICSGLDSKRPNAILLCDGCNLAVHQNCYRVAKVPRGEWFCNDCKSKRNDIELNNELEVEEVVEFPEVEGFEEHLRTMQTFLLGRLTGSQHIRLQGHNEEMDKVHQVVKQTVLAGEGNSMLVIGARGSGKTTLIQSIISDLSPHRDNFHLVKLNGFIHTDDKLALKEIWRQLGREMEVEDDNKATANDTLQSLLALLSHPTEISESAEGQTTRSVVFVLDEFDLFTTHPRQTLLYNLFDIAQARKAPIVVLGLTTRVDVVETLEKRVKSRFSHRHVHLSLPRSVPAFWEICKTGLTADTESLQAAGIDVEAQGLDDFLAYWRSMVDDLHMNATFKHYLESHFYRSKSVSAFFTSCILPLASLSAKNFPLTAKAFTSPSVSLLAPDSKLHMLGGLSELELAMLISAARLDIILDTDTCNFAMVYDEYCRLTSRHKIQTSSTGIAALGAGAKVWGREVALGAWERLAQYDILVPAGVGGGSARDLGAGGRMWKVDIGLEEIAGSVGGLSTIMTKWCREI